MLTYQSRNIQRLRNTIGELQARDTQDQAPCKYAIPHQSDNVSISPQESHVSLPLYSTSPTLGWKDVQIHEAHGGAVYHGPRSSSYFGARMDQFMAKVMSKYPDSQNPCHDRRASRIHCSEGKDLYRSIAFTHL